MQYADIPYARRPVSRIIFGTSMSPFLEGGGGVRGWPLTRE